SLCLHDALPIVVIMVSNSSGLPLLSLSLPKSEMVAYEVFAPPFSHKFPTELFSKSKLLSNRLTVVADEVADVELSYPILNSYVLRSRFGWLVSLSTVPSCLYTKTTFP